MSFIIHSPNHICVIAICQNSTVCQCTNIFANHIRLAIIMLKLKPLSLIRIFAEFFY